MIALSPAAEQVSRIVIPLLASACLDDVRTTFWETLRSGGSLVGVQLERDPARIPSPEPDHTGEHQPHATARKPRRRGEGARLGMGKPPRARDDFAVERGARRISLPDGPEPDPLRLTPRLPLRLGSGARRRSARDRGAGPF